MTFFALPFRMIYPPVLCLVYQASGALGGYVCARFYTYLNGGIQDSSRITDIATSAGAIVGVMFISLLNFDPFTTTLAAGGALIGYACSTYLSNDDSPSSFRNKDRTWLDSLGLVAAGTVLGTVIAAATRQLFYNHFVPSYTLSFEPGGIQSSSRNPCPINAHNC